MKYAIAAIIGLLTGTAHLLTAAPQYAITDLGTFQNNSGDSFAWGINASSQIVGCSVVGSDSGNEHAFLYDGDQLPPMKDIGPLGQGSRGNAINDGGVIVGSIDETNSNLYHAAFYNGNTMEELPITGDVFSRAFGINANGVIVGMFRAQGFDQHAFIFDSDKPQPLVDIGALISADPGLESSAIGINSAGQVIGAFSDELVANNGAQHHAFLYDQNKSPKITDLGTLEPNGAAWALAINDVGQITGCAEKGGDFHVFFYDASQSPPMKDIGPLSTEASYGYDINNHGHVVGTFTWNGADYAFFHDGAVTHNLNDLIPPNSGWVLVQANAINDNGVIVGYGKINGETHAYRLDPTSAPNPTPTIQFTPNFAAPTVKILGKKKRTILKRSIRIKGNAIGVVTSVIVKNGKKKRKLAIGTTHWRAKIRLKPGKNKISAIATGPGGTSIPAKIIIRRHFHESFHGPDDGHPH